ncbi:MAG: MlaC/ttg2D family ABC transporter substrate-binding protein [Candidatus Rokuibacteriota bacterium]
MSGPLAALAALATFVLGASGPAVAGPPTDQVKDRVDRVVKVLDDPQMRLDGRTAERRAAIRAIASELFDFREISQRSLARHWQQRTPAEREEFSRLFGDLLEQAYVSKIELYSGEKIQYLGEMVDGEYAIVRTRLVTKQGTEIPVDYRLLRRGDQWRAYDVLIEGVSLVGNYRTQFNAVIQRSSYDGLVKALRAKRDEATRAPAPPPGGKPAAAPPPPVRPQSP